MRKRQKLNQPIVGNLRKAVKHTTQVVQFERQLYQTLRKYTQTSKFVFNKRRHLGVHLFYRLWVFGFRSLLISLLFAKGLAIFTSPLCIYCCWKYVAVSVCSLVFGFLVYSCVLIFVRLDLFLSGQR